MAVFLALSALLALPSAAAARPRPPVVFVVFDEFPTTSLLGAHRRIDSVRLPNFSALARDATWFRNTTTVHDSSFASIPSMLNGTRPRYLKGAARHGPRTSVLGLLARHGYRLHASAEARGICPPRDCPHVRSTRYYLVRSRRGRFSQFVRSIVPSRSPTVWFKHTLLPHVPWIYLPDGKQYQRGVHGPIPGLNSELGARDPYVVHLAQQRHLLQVGAVDRLLGMLLAQLKRTGLYDRALLVVTADEGVSFQVGQLDRRIVTRRNVQDIGPVPLFVKLPHQRRGRVSRVYARTADVAPTIAGVLHLRMPWRTAGRSVYSRAVRRRRGVRVGSRKPGAPRVAMGGRPFQAAWSRSIRHFHALFGFGNRGPGLFGIGPARRLLGRKLASLPVAPRRRVRARLSGARALAAVRLRSRFRPVFIAGRILGGRRGARRAIAVALNGEVAATGRSFYLRGSRRESFAVLVPDTLLREGRNRVQVLSMRRARGRLRFRSLGTF